MLDVKTWSTEWGGRTLTVEVGKMALQATASCTVRYGDTVMLATVVQSDRLGPGDYFPLMVSFEEKLYAAGKIKGSRFIKREGRPSDESILSGRVIDRALRPLFDDRMRNNIQVVVTALSVDQENDAAIVGLIAASCVLSISPIPWNGPLGATRIGKKDGKLILNATREEIKTGDLDLVVAGTTEKLVMVEAAANELSEDEMYEAMKWGGEQLSPIIDLVNKMVKELGVEKNLVEDILADTGVSNEEQTAVTELTRSFVASLADTMIFDSPKVTRKERQDMVKAVKAAAKQHLFDKGISEDLWGAGLDHIKDFIANQITLRILDKKQRLDGRSLTEVRDLLSEIDLLPRVHGTGMFMRGDTQVLSIVTLGSPGDVQTLDTMEEDGTKRYMHHYNDAPYTYGDARPMRGPSRRAIGHGALAERALEPVLPAVEDFPYTIRVMSEVMGSNGSSSMASTCGSSLSLMAAGVPIKKAVAGIAMGLASDETDRWEVLTDLQDVEDGKGGMDFKIAGTRDGITAMQMDTKTHGVNWDIVKQTVTQSHDAIAHILSTMESAIAEPRADLSEYAPRIETVVIDPDKIRDIIGPGGKTINKIIADTGVQIDIEQDGRVIITSNDQEGMKQALEIVHNLTKEVLAGEIYDGTVVRLEDFGAFVNILPNKDGLVHVSEIAWERTNKPGDVLKLNDKVQVKVKEVDNLGRVNLSIKALKDKPEGYQPPPPRESRGFSGGKKPGGHHRGPRKDGPRKDSPKKDAPPVKKGFFGRKKDA
ncbi:MAG: polyribonucleotide nucleotidyltransferase [Candidatus Magasanikbacteria bacterium]|jgi:polyribonucleotide nucleotidyltransferase|nr:polyribonucleotide nucleotidyltransferase [Candidatus Magasanikbacteria bacterium]MBT4221017.1 polyribonucleotide nucleotidyltransferase [Candidatus Magasanikbacteria bacterium]MBT4350535.1 polyribonucleotide nucleotidyltransferase [Candidatus Magasanikbacteria bacterium]MBT4541912.1 polyribonucleotide nucleotidyltransferase [Candidatus Magasanikbacteria bacterium]MBT6253043.1 polyribonucleotide nucleotidyltransferase [Candidatus Magasanikbacteria bacterium]